MSTFSEEKLLQNFIFDDKVQAILSDINDKFIDFNILEITGIAMLLKILEYPSQPCIVGFLLQIKKIISLNVIYSVS